MGAQHRILYQLFSFISLLPHKTIVFPVQYLLVNLNFKIQNKISVFFLKPRCHKCITYFFEHTVQTINKCMDFYSMSHFFQCLGKSAIFFLFTVLSQTVHFKSSQISSKFSLLVKSCWDLKFLRRKMYFKKITP